MELEKEKEKGLTEFEIIEKFNGLSIDLATQIAMLTPDSIIANNLNQFINVVKMNPKKLIELFIIHILPDKDKIDEGDDNYFMGKTYQKITGDNSVMIKNVFEFKNIWVFLNSENRMAVIQYMRCLCYYSQLYFMEKDTYFKDKK